MEDLFNLQKEVIRCRKCPRLVKYLNQIRDKYPTYWSRPVPSFGDPRAQILIVGLAPGRFGSNRTGRMFTGDASGEFLYKTLYEVGLCNNQLRRSLPWQAPTDINDGLSLKNCYITAMARCAPPQNKPTPRELENCFPYFEEEIKLLKDIRVVVTLGRIAFDGYLKWLFKSVVANLCVCPMKRKDFKFSHGAIYKSKHLPHILIASYHPSRQNTQTGKLAPRMFKQIFQKALQYCNE